MLWHLMNRAAANRSASSFSADGLANLIISTGIFSPWVVFKAKPVVALNYICRLLQAFQEPVGVSSLKKIVPAGFDIYVV